MKWPDTSSKIPSAPSHVTNISSPMLKTPSASFQLRKTTKTTSTSKVDLHCFVARNLLSRIYGLFWCIVLKMWWWCTKNYKYEVCMIRSSYPEKSRAKHPRMEEGHLTLPWLADWRQRGRGDGSQWWMDCNLHMVCGKQTNKQNKNKQANKTN